MPGILKTIDGDGSRIFLWESHFCSRDHLFSLCFGRPGAAFPPRSQAPPCLMSSSDSSECGELGAGLMGDWVADIPY